MNRPTVSIITACFKSEKTIGDTIRSVLAQTYPVEYIIVDGASPDGTVSAARAALEGAKISYRIISEPDRGMYDAMRKGISQASGEVVAILNADDRFETPESVEKIMRVFSPDIDVVLADVVITDGNFDRILRYYSARSFEPSQLLRGIMPPHAGFYARRAMFERLGSYKADYRYAGDFELITRFLLKGNLRWVHLPEVVVRMRTGGLSNRSLRHRFELNREVIRALRENGFPGSWGLVLSKIPGKLLQYLLRPASGPVQGSP